MGRGRDKRRRKKRKRTKPTRFKSKESYRKFRAYQHMRTPTGLLVRAKEGRRSISEQTPIERKERVVVVAGKRHKVELSIPSGDARKR